MKNFSRISNILGTWTSTTHLKADIGSYELMAYFVIHFMPDPMSAYRCSLDLCDELENNVCVMSSSDHADSSTNMDNKCQKMQDSIVEWSDGTITRFVGANVGQSQIQFSFYLTYLHCSRCIHVLWRYVCFNKTACMGISHLNLGSKKDFFHSLSITVYSQGRRRVSIQ
jgi:hypothetical protein